MNTHLKVDINSLCRTCLTTSMNLRTLSAQISDTRTIFDALTNVINKDIAISELLPYKICSECETVLYQCDIFKQKVLENEDILKNWFLSAACESENCLKDEEENERDPPLITIPYQCSICLMKYMNIIDLQDHYANVHVVKNDKVQLFHTQDRNGIYCNVYTNLKDESSDSDSSYSESENDAEELPEQLLNNEPEKIPQQILNDRIQDVQITEALDDNKDNVVIVEIENVAKEPEKFYCDICNLNYKSAKAIKIHTKKKHGYHLVDEIKTGPGETFKCSMCMRKFDNKNSLERHLEKHKEKLKKVFSCNICKREFQHQAHLDNHMESLHSNDKEIAEKLTSSYKKHTCKTCGKKFNMLSTLREHIRVHTGEKPFLCSTCGRGFSQRTNLKEHIRRHQGLKPFKCDTCEQRFVSKGELVAHMRTHTGAHPFVCDICNHRFTTSSSLVKHKRIHTGEKPFSCDLCPMKFAASGTLKNHKRTHTGEKPFHCAHCDKAFIQRNDLVAHTRCHTGERPYVCSVCGQRFRQNSALKTHFKIHNFKETPGLLLRKQVMS